MRIINIALELLLAFARDENLLTTKRDNEIVKCNWLLGAQFCFQSRALQL